MTGNFSTENIETDCHVVIAVRGPEDFRPLLNMGYSLAKANQGKLTMVTVRQVVQVPEWLPATHTTTPTNTPTVTPTATPTLTFTPTPSLAIVANTRGQGGKLRWIPGGPPSQVCFQKAHN